MVDFGRFFLPGPSEVRPEVLEAMLRPMVPHRGPECARLFLAVQPGLQKLFGTERTVILAASSATAMMEAGVRALPPGKILSLVNGGFSERFAQIAEACGREVNRVEVAWGEVHDPAQVTAHGFAGVTVVHSETSTGALQPLATLRKAAGDTPLVVDSVSGLAAVPLDFDDTGLAFACSGSQKALALPPGLAFAVTTLEGAGDSFYLDVQRYLQKQPPFTPALPQIYALEAQLQRVAEEGLDARFARHAAMAELTWAWAEERGLEVLAVPAHRSPSVTCIRAPESLTGPDIAARVAERGYTIGAGYGKLHESTFRIGHMGDQDLETLEALLEVCAEAIVVR